MRTRGDARDINGGRHHAAVAALSIVVYLIFDAWAEAVQHR